MPTDDRRQHIRLHPHFPVTYRLLGSQEPRGSVTRDISSGGLCFLTADRLAPGTMVELAVECPGLAAPVRVTAEVMWSGKLIPQSDSPAQPHHFETGARFLKIDAADLQALLQASPAPPIQPPSNGEVSGSPQNRIDT